MGLHISHLGADDGVPMIQAYYYDGDYINIFTQEIINSCSWSQELTHESTTCSSPSSSETASLEDFPALPTQGPNCGSRGLHSCPQPGGLPKSRSLFPLT